MQSAAFKPQHPDLLEEAAKVFADLNRSETTLLNNIPTGNITYCGPSNSDTDKDNDPTNANTWASTRTVRSSLLMWLCTNHSDSIPLKGIQLHSAIIKGELNLSYTEIPFRLIFRLCSFTDDIDMRMLSARELSLSYSRLKALNLSRATIKGSLLVSHCRFDRTVLMTNIHVGEEFRCDGTIFSGYTPTGRSFADKALDCSGITVGSNVSITKVTAHTATYFTNAKIGGDFDASGSFFKSEFAATQSGDSDALNANSAQVNGDITLGDGLKSFGTLNFDQITCGGSIELRDGSALFAPSPSETDANYAFTCADSRIGRSLTLDDKCHCNGSFNISATHIGGHFEAIGSFITQSPSRVISTANTALEAGNTIISGDVRFSGIVAVGKLDFERSEIGGDFFCDNAKLASYPQVSESYSLDLRLSNVKGAVNMDGTVSNGSMVLINMKTGGDLKLTNASITATKAKEGRLFGPALSLEGAVIGGSVQMSKGCFYGQVNVQFATINENLQCTSALFSNSFIRGDDNTGSALLASRSIIKSNILLNGNCVALGLVTVASATVGGSMNCNSATFCRSLNDLDPNKGVAFTCYRLQISGDLTLSGQTPLDGAGPIIAFVSHGGIELDQAQVGGEVYIDKAHLNNGHQIGFPRTGRALSAFGVKVSRGFNIRSSTVEGETYVANSSVGEAIDFSASTFSCPGSTSGGSGDRVLSVVSSSAAGLYLVKDCRVFGFLDLHSTSVSVFYDDATAWPKNGQLDVEGFVYKSFGRDPMNAKRLSWLSLQSSASVPTQSYIQLAKVLTDRGDDEGAKQVLIALEDLRSHDTSTEQLHLQGLSRRVFLGRTIGYGYRPLNAIWGLGFLTVLGWIIYRRSYLQGNMVPTDKEVYKLVMEAGERVPPQYGRFSAFIYSLENTIPLLKLGQTDKWRPVSHTTSKLCTSQKNKEDDGSFVDKVSRWLKRADVIERLARPPLTRYLLWIQILLGWILATLFVAGMTGLVHK